MPRAIEELVCNKIKLPRAPQLCRWRWVRGKLWQICEIMNSIGKEMVSHSWSWDMDWRSMQSAVNARTVRAFTEIWGKFLKERFSSSYQPSEVVLPADAQEVPKLLSDEGGRAHRRNIALNLCTLCAIVYCWKPWGWVFDLAVNLMLIVNLMLWTIYTTYRKDRHTCGIVMLLMSGLCGNSPFSFRMYALVITGLLWRKTKEHPSYEGTLLPSRQVPDLGN